MSSNLKPLLLPQLVEERRKRESILDSDMDVASSSFYSQTSSTSEIPSPVASTFSNRGHLRYSSSTSSIESTYQNPTTDSPSSPTFTISKTSKRSLPDVQEEPQERDEDFEMLDDASELYDCLCDSQECLHRESMTQSSEQLPMRHEFDYDLAEGFLSDGDFALSPRYKKRRANETALNGLATRKGQSSTSPTSEGQREYTISQTASSRSSSVSNSARQALEPAFEPHMPPTPTRSVFGSREDVSITAPIDIEKANNGEEDREENFATTPLLPPLMIDAAAHNKHVFMQSPLQSPSVAESKDYFAGSITPIDSITTSQFPGSPSPPLSSKPSISSFHRSTTTRPGQLCPSSEIPPIVIADPNDEWANKLGHANFNIYPEPYLPEDFDLEACRQLRSNWDLARCNYTKHLVRTGEHYGATSKTYKLTEEKWASVDAIWRRYNDLTIGNTAQSSGDAFATLKHTKIEGNGNNVMTRIPSLNDPRSMGKFPQLGDEDIIGPMVQVAAKLQRSPSKKAKLFKYLAEKFPANLGRS
ncbi:hypothetical protein LOCC1_G000111 [Lachnellula occidentalis]|uniref:Only prolin and serin are matching in the corresponding protein n=1 Tax=Lachnellula occidentalis TaxID=215460 RepID=A0A8H8S9F0_9HELO|nr:hypothetical protein LOCC1_G000111 [Lachnellula occidentalis]